MIIPSIADEVNTPTRKQLRRLVGDERFGFALLSNTPASLIIRSASSASEDDEEPSQGTDMPSFNTKYTSSKYLLLAFLT